MKVRRNISERPRRGGAILETALVLPVLIAITFGAMEFGYYYWIQNTLEGAARNGARAAIISGATNSDVTTAVDAELTAAGLTPSSYSIVTDPTDISGTSAGTNVTVTVSASWGQVGLKILGIIGSDKSVSGVCVMRHE